MQEVNLIDLLANANGEETPATIEARRTMEVCNACRYCEGYCAVFPAMTLKREFTSGDLTHLANLCHSCRGCYYACQYAPPHEFGINVPKVLAEVRAESYQHHAWPGFVARAFDRNGLVVSLTTAAALVTVLVLTATLNQSELFRQHDLTPGRGVYEVVSYGAMVGFASVTFLYSLLALLIGALRFRRTIGLNWREIATPIVLLRGLRDAATLRNLGGGGHGCNDRDESFSTERRLAHHALAYGFLLCFASTSTGTIYDHLFGWHAPYPLLSLPVVLGTVGGVGMTVGGIGLLWLKMSGDQAPQARRQLGADSALLILLTLIAVSGLLLLAVRSTEAMGLTLVVHLGLVLSFFVIMPYSKFVHGIYRTAALIKNASDRRGTSGTTGAKAGGRER